MPPAGAHAGACAATLVAVVAAVVRLAGASSPAPHAVAASAAVTITGSEASARSPRRCYGRRRARRGALPPVTIPRWTAPRDSLSGVSSLRAIGEAQDAEDRARAAAMSVAERLARGVELSAFAVRMRNAFSEQSLRS